MERSRSDAELVLSARDGDREAFGVLLTRHRPLLLAMCRRALPDVSLAEDVAQEASIQAFLSLDRLRQPERFGAWLVGIGLNLCHRRRRQFFRDARSWEAMLGGSRITEPVDPASGPEDLAEALELREWIAGVVQSLPPGQRAAVVLHYLDGLTQAETATALGIVVGAVKARLHKARSNLRPVLSPEFGALLVRTGGSTMIEMRLSDVRRRLPEEGVPPRHIVILEEIAGPRHLTIWIGEIEANALALALEKIPYPRPLTYDFAAGLLRASGGKLHEVRIGRLEGETFIASAVIDGPAGQKQIDARPSDALNLALHLGSPIRVDSEVLAAAGSVREGEEWTRLAELSQGAPIIAAGVVAGWEANYPSHPSSEQSQEP